MEGEPFHGNAVTSAYTTGSTPWTLDVHCFNTGKVSATTNARALTYGPIKLEPFVDDDFELSTWTPAAPAVPVVNDLYVRVQRKTGATGHPAAGTHTFQITARNFQGPTVLNVTVTVPEPASG